MAISTWMRLLWPTAVFASLQERTGLRSFCIAPVSDRYVGIAEKTMGRVDLRARVPSVRRDSDALLLRAEAQAHFVTIVLPDTGRLLLADQRQPGCASE